MDKTLIAGIVLVVIITFIICLLITMYIKKEMYVDTNKLLPYEAPIDPYMGSYSYEAPQYGDYSYTFRRYIRPYYTYYAPQRWMKHFGEWYNTI